MRRGPSILLLTKQAPLLELLRQLYRQPGVSIVLLTRQGLLFLRGPHALRWRLETFGLYMPSYPEARPWWRVNRRALAAFMRQLPAYTRWLTGMRALRQGGAHGYWAARTGTGAREWEAWLDIAEGEDSSR